MEAAARRPTWSAAVHEMSVYIRDVRSSQTHVALTPTALLYATHATLPLNPMECPPEVTCGNAVGSSQALNLAFQDGCPGLLDVRMDICGICKGQLWSHDSTNEAPLENATSVVAPRPPKVLLPSTVKERGAEMGAPLEKVDKRSGTSRNTHQPSETKSRAAEGASIEPKR